MLYTTDELKAAADHLLRRLAGIPQPEGEREPYPVAEQLAAVQLEEMGVVKYRPLYEGGPSEYVPELTEFGREVLSRGEWPTNFSPVDIDDDLDLELLLNL